MSSVVCGFFNLLTRAAPGGSEVRVRLRVRVMFRVRVRFRFRIGFRVLVMVRVGLAVRLQAARRYAGVLVFQVDHR